VTHPQSRVHGIVNQAIRDGRLVRQPCEVCGATSSKSVAIDAHHRYGYDDPLLVVWLCRSHHLIEHNHPGVRTQVVSLFEDGVYQSEIARMVGVSRQRVSQILGLTRP